MGLIGYGVDAPGTVCAFGVRCSQAMIGRGGFDQHHPWPMDTGGPDGQVRVILCPNHHRRQHALVRYLIEQVLGGEDKHASVTERFSTAERQLAEQAVAKWEEAGRPDVHAWPCPAARAVLV